MRFFIIVNLLLKSSIYYVKSQPFSAASNAEILNALLAVMLPRFRGKPMGMIPS